MGVNNELFLRVGGGSLAGKTYSREGLGEGHDVALKASGSGNNGGMFLREFL